MCLARQACPYMYAPWACKYARALVPSRQHLSLLFLHPFPGGWGATRSSLLISHPSSGLNHDPHFSSTIFFFSFDSFDPFSLSFPPLIFLCLEIRSKVWETGRRCCAVPVPGGQRQRDVRLLPGLGAECAKGCQALSAPQSSLGSASGVHAVRQPDSIFQ